MLTFLKLMERKELSPVRVAAEMQIRGHKGLAVNTVKNWAAGAFTPSMKFIPALCEVLNVTPVELIGACGASVEERKAQERARVAVA